MLVWAQHSEPEWSDLHADLRGGPMAGGQVQSGPICNAPTSAARAAMVHSDICLKRWTLWSSAAPATCKLFKHSRRVSNHPPHFIPLQITQHEARYHASSRRTRHHLNCLRCAGRGAWLSRSRVPPRERACFAFARHPYRLWQPSPYAYDRSPLSHMHLADFVSARYMRRNTPPIPPASDSLLSGLGISGIVNTAGMSIINFIQ